MKGFLTIVIFLIATIYGVAQKSIDLSFEFQVYPTGIIPGVHFEKSINTNSAILMRFGYNWFRHRDLGVHDDERGGGIGGSVGYKRYFKGGLKGLHLSLKNDIWFNNVDWYDINPIDGQIDGETSIIVLQPTIELGYTFISSSSLIIIPTLSFGYEWNAKTSGEPTGQGAILLLGVQIGKRF